MTTASPAGDSPEALPASVSIDLDQPLKRYWRDRVQQHLSDRYCGVRISKFPEDLRTYEHLLWLARPDTVIEIGSQFGGSALWFRDRLEALRHYGQIERVNVVAVDIDVEPLLRGLQSVDPGYSDTIQVVEGDVTEAGLPDSIAARLAPGARCLVVEDSAHTEQTTRAALEGFAQFVPAGGFFVVEDGCVDIESLRAAPQWPRGVLPALHDWLATDQGEAFRVRRDLELYGITCHPEGYLQRI